MKSIRCYTTNPSLVNSSTLSQSLSLFLIFTFLICYDVHDVRSSHFDNRNDYVTILLEKFS